MPIEVIGTGILQMTWTCITFVTGVPTVSIVHDVFVLCDSLFMIVLSKLQNPSIMSDWQDRHSLLTACSASPVGGVRFSVFGMRFGINHHAIAMAQSGCSYGWAAQIVKCCTEHGKYRPVVAGAPVEVQPDELQPGFDSLLRSRAG